MADPDDAAVVRAEIAIIQEVIEAVDRRWDALAGRCPVCVPRPLVYATVLHAVLVSAGERSAPIRLGDAPLLDSIIDGVDAADGCDVFDRILEAIRVN